jgi:hypothetical protein
VEQGARAINRGGLRPTVPLSFAPGEAWTTVIVKVAHVRLCHSRMMFVRAYPRETQEMVFDAHDRAFALFNGTRSRGIYDNMKTAVETIFVGKDQPYATSCERLRTAFRARKMHLALNR